MDLRQIELWPLLLLAAAVIIGLYFRAEAICDAKAPALVRWVVKVLAGIIAWDLLGQLPVLTHIRI